jgi:Protein of unknown function (DUF2911)
MKTLLRSALTALLVAGFAAPALHAKAPQSSEPGSMPEMKAQAGDTKAMPSPPAVANTIVAGKAITIHYNTPFMRDRKIMGELVPYGKVWRTGANPATSFVTEGDLMIGDLKVPAGKYTLYTLPGAPGTPWQLIINKQTGQWGTEYHQEQDLGRVPMHLFKMPAPQEQMSITFEKGTNKTTQLHVQWETTDVWVEIKAAS